MAVFYSFHYGRDAWRVQQILNIGALDSQTILNAQEWESVKRKGDAAIKQWIADQMAYKQAVVVLVGLETSTRPWVVYEIQKAWQDKRPLVGIRIHGLQNSAKAVDTPGPNPFSLIKLDTGGTMGDYVPVHAPSGSTSGDVYASIKANLTTWVAGAYKRS